MEQQVEARSIFDTISRFIRKGPPVNVEGLAKALGIDVKYAYLESDISGQIEQYKPGRFRITVNAADAPTRQRFSIAHELGHFVYHRPLIGDGVDDDRAYRSTAKGRYHNQLIGPSQETQANSFAANLLIPDSLLRQEQRSGHVDVNDMAHRFEVSRHAMSIRLGYPYEN